MGLHIRAVVELLRTEYVTALAREIVRHAN
jgi:hypothetical protein